KIAEKPRMADFALWAEACTRAYWPAVTFLQAYRENIAGAVELVLEANAVDEAVRHHFMPTQSSWLGTASGLLPLLTSRVPESAAREGGWPKRGDSLGGTLPGVAPALRRTGIHIAFDRGGHARTRIIRIEKRTEAEPEHGRKKASAASAASAGGTKPSEDSHLDADSADSMRTAAPAAGVRGSPLKNPGEDSADSAGSSLHLSTGNGPGSDVDAVLAELAAQRDI